MAFTQQGAVLTAPSAASQAQFGSALALNGARTVMAVGAKNANLQKGQVHIFDLVSGTWTQRGSPLTAADGATYDGFGESVALSNDGLVLAVGAPYWEGSLTDQGAVYIYDWNGSAWVLRGGAPLTASDAAAGDGFGTSVALSSTGAILAVGAPFWEGTLADQGGVYIFDWTTVWTQRGAVIVSPTVVAGEYFGSGVALSDTGTVLVVGAERYSGAGGTLQGAAYTFDWSGSAWGQRGSRLVASDAGAYDGFGVRASLSGDGAILAISASRWKNNGFAGHVYVYTVSGSAWTEREHFGASDTADGDSFGAGIDVSSSALAVGALGWEGTLTDQGGVYFFTDQDTISCPTLLTIVAPTGVVSCPTKLSVQATGTVSCPTALVVVTAGHVPNWTAVCVLGGVDVSNQLIGVARVTADEGAARVATITLNPPSGTVAPLDYVGKTITLDYALIINGTSVPRRLFTGRVDTPNYDPNTTLLTLTCTDDLQNRVAALSRTVLDSLIGGRYSEAVQGDILDNWDYAQARMSTIAGSLDAGPSGGMRVTPWQIATSWATYGDGDLIYKRSSVSYPQRSTLVNRVDIAFDYRYTRLRQRYAWTSFGATQVDMAPNGWQYPTQQDLIGAASGTGWTVVGGVYYPAPASIPHSSGGFVDTQPGAIDLAMIALTQRHSQTITEAYTLVVTADESIAINGTLGHALRGALASSFDGSAWESALDVAPLLDGGGEMDYAPDASRGNAEYAIQTLLDQANAKILGSHRSARVGNAVLCNPDLDLDKKITLAASGHAASGKVAQVEHVLDFERGSAITEFAIACFGIGGAGILTPDTLLPPAAPPEATGQQDWGGSIPPMFVHNYGITPYQAGLMGLLINPPETVFVRDIPGEGSKSLPNPYYVAGSYPVTGFRMQMPGVDDSDRNPTQISAASTYRVVITPDPLTFTKP